MSLFPHIGLYQPFHIGDNVLVEPIAAELSTHVDQKIYVLSKYSDMFNEHPSVIGMPLDGTGWPPDIRVIDMTESIQSLREDGDKRYALAGKVKRMWQAAGLSYTPAQPQLYLSEWEKGRATGLRGLLDVRPCVGVVLASRSTMKNYPYVKYLIKRLKCRYNVFIIGATIPDKLAGVENGVYNVIGKTLRELMIYLSFMDVVVGPDTGPVHIAAALGTHIVVITRDFWKDIYDGYNNCELVTSKYFGKRALYTIPPKQVLSAVHDVVSLPQEKPIYKQYKTDADDIALFRLDGLGGTVTLIDQAKKIFEQTGKPVVLIVRNYGDVFENIPYIKQVIEVGHVKWGECLAEMLTKFNTIGEIRFGIGKWHQQNGRIFDQDFEPMRGLFERFPLDLMKLEVHGMHHILTTDMSLGLPYDKIEGEIRNFKKHGFAVPERYLLVNNGVDVQHTGMLQTKSWYGWDELSGLLDIPIVQVGTLHDHAVKDAVDLRGKTTIPQLFTMIRDAKIVLCGEGGIMHLGHFTGSKHVVVMRGPTRGKLFEYPGQRLVDSYICDPCCGDTPDWYMNCPCGIDAICMKSITPERVAYNIMEVLNEDLVTSARI